jgi:glycine cleavage system H protein
MRAALAQKRTETTMYPSHLKYTKDHEWLNVEGGDAGIGITDFAQRQLGDIVFVELPQVGRQLTQGEAFGTVESVKAVSELFAPVSGEVMAVNGDLGAHPEAVNATPHAAWMIRLRPSNPAEVANLLDAAAYTELVK